MTSYKTTNWVQKIYRDTDTWCTGGRTPPSTLPKHYVQIPNCKAECRIRSELWFGDPVLLSYGRTIYQSFNHDDNSISRRTKLYEISRQWSNDFQEGIDRTGIATYTANNYRTKSAGTNHRDIHSSIEKASSANDDKCTKSSDGKHTYRWMNKHTRRRASEGAPRSETISSPSIRRTSNIPANTPEKRW